MKYLLDTNICSAYLKRPGGLAHFFLQNAGHLAISAVVLAELYTWAFRRPKPEKLLRIISQDLLPEIKVIDFDANVAWTFGELRANLLPRGIIVSPIDLMIASTAIQHGLVMVTHNVKHFDVIPGLRVIDWLEP